jgi:hypothetical protein
MLFRDENLGCKRSVSSAIDWFFAENRIVLEDDCLPSASFFRSARHCWSDRMRSTRFLHTEFRCSPKTPGGSCLFSKMFYMWAGRAGPTAGGQSASTMDVRVCGAIVDERWLGNSLTRESWLDIVGQQATGGIDSWGCGHVPL